MFRVSFGVFDGVVPASVSKEISLNSFFQERLLNDTLYFSIAQLFNDFDDFMRNCKPETKPNQIFDDAGGNFGRKFGLICSNTH